MIKFKHLRNASQAYELAPGRVARLGINNLGGLTLAFEEKTDGSFEVGAALCSKKDNFCYRVGRDKAIERLRSTPATLSREELECLIGYGMYLGEIRYLGADALESQTKLPLDAAYIC